MALLNPPYAPIPPDENITGLTNPLTENLDVAGYDLDNAKSINGTLTRIVLDDNNINGTGKSVGVYAARIPLQINIENAGDGFVVVYDVTGGHYLLFSPNSIQTDQDLGVNGTTLSPSGNATFSANVFMPNLPTSDPGVAGQLWSNLGILTISAG